MDVEGNASPWVSSSIVFCLVAWGQGLSLMWKLLVRLTVLWALSIHCPSPSTPRLHTHPCVTFYVGIGDSKLGSPFYKHSYPQSHFSALLYGFEDTGDLRPWSQGVSVFEAKSLILQESVLGKTHISKVLCVPGNSLMPGWDGGLRRLWCRQRRKQIV